VPDPSEVLNDDGERSFPPTAKCEPVGAKQKSSPDWRSSPSSGWSFPWQPRSDRPRPLGSKQARDQLVIGAKQGTRWGGACSSPILAGIVRISLPVGPPRWESSGPTDHPNQSPVRLKNGEFGFGARPRHEWGKEIFLAGPIANVDLAIDSPARNQPPIRDRRCPTACTPPRDCCPGGWSRPTRRFDWALHKQPGVGPWDRRSRKGGGGS